MPGWRCWRAAPWPGRQAARDSRTAGIGAALALGLGFTFWSQAIVYETYIAMALLFALLLALALSHDRRPWVVLAAGHLTGLALTHHLSALAWLPALLILSGCSRRDLLRWGAGLLTGLWPVALLLLFSLRGGPPDWGQVRDGLPALVTHISGSAFSGFLVPFTLAGWLGSMGDGLALLWRDLTTIGCILAVVGVAVSLRRGRRPALSCMLLFGALSAVTSVYTAADTSTVYRLPVTVMACWFAGQGAGWLAGRLHRAAGALLVTILAASLLTAHLPDVSLHGDTSQRDFMAEARALPPGSLIVTARTETTFRLWYACEVQRACPDWLVLNLNLMQFDWYARRIGAAQPGLTPYTPDDVPGWLAQDAWRGRPIATELVFFGLRGRTLSHAGGWQVWAAD
jgi:hypothetical protein